MKPVAKQTREMTHTLESAGFNRNQSETLVETMSEMVETLAVTPKILRESQEKLKTEILTHLDKRLSAQDTKIDGIAKATKANTDEIKAIKATLKDHGTILAEHSAILREHGTILAEHSAVLREHGSILKEQGAILREHGTLLKEQAEAIKERGEAIKQNTFEIKGLKAQIDTISEDIRDIKRSLDDQRKSTTNHLLVFAAAIITSMAALFGAFAYTLT